MGRRKHHRAYGVVWDESQSSPTLARIGQGMSSPVAAKLPDNLMALQSRVRGCVLNDAGVVQYYTGATDRTKKEDMVTPSVLTGADGQVMNEIPQGWLKYWYENSKHHYLISKEQFNGAERLNAFYKNDEWVKNRYMSAYEGVLYDTSAGIYANGIYQTAVSCVFASADSSLTIASRPGVFSKLAVGDKIVVSGTAANNGTKTVATLESATKITIAEAVTDGTDAATVIETEKDFTATTGDKLCSVSGKAPINYATRAHFRTLAKNRGTGWRQQDYDLVSAIQLLYITEYASWYSQSMIGVGITNVPAPDWSAYNDYNPIAFTGNSNSIGNATGNTGGSTSALTESTKYLSYRGIENFFGHLWKWADGININNYVPYVSNKDTDFADATAANYTALGITLANTNGYQKTLAQQDRGFLPASVGGASNTYITDYYYQSSGWGGALLVGSVSGGADAGVAYLNVYNVSSYRQRYISGRLSF